ncbi:MAG: hypothetical protein ACP5JL_07615 [bacterium]
MSEKELKRVETIERLIRGEITNTQAATLLGLSVRQIKRIVSFWKFPLSNVWAVGVKRSKAIAKSETTRGFRVWRKST